jgi:large subunit ribosomal protein L30
MRITLRRSLIGVPRDQRATVRALGLRKIGDSRDVATTRDMRGMVAKVAYLLRVEAAAPSNAGDAAQQPAAPAERGDQQQPAAPAERGEQQQAAAPAEDGEEQPAEDGEDSDEQGTDSEGQEPA